MPRRGENIYRRKDGRWEGRYVKGRSKDGKALYGYVYGKTYTEVKNKRLEKLTTISSGDPILAKCDSTDENYYFSVLSDIWLESIRPQIKQSTYNKYKNLIHSYIISELNEIKISDLTVESLQRKCNHLLEHGGKEGHGLSTKTVGDVLSLIRRLLSYAASIGYPVKCSGREFSIKQSAKEMCILCHSEQETLCQYLLQNRDEKNIGIFLCLFTGLRIGELCALKWDDISLENGTIYIHQIIQRIQIHDTPNKKTAVLIMTPKSKCSIRTIPIPSNVVQLLKDTSITKKGYLVTGTEEHYLEPRTMQLHFKRVLEQANLRQVNFHALRHTFATRCVEVGFDIKSLSEILGHSNVTITMDRYVHPSMELKKENMQKLSSLFAVI